MGAAVYSSLTVCVSPSSSLLRRRREDQPPPSFFPRETSSRGRSVRVEATAIRSDLVAKTMEWTIHSAAAATGGSWQSSLASNAVIFALGSPLLLAGLNLPGIVAAFLLGTLTWRAFGPPAFLLVAAYFVLGTAATKLRLAQKEAEGVAERRKGRRGPASVLGSSAAGCVCAFLSLYFPDTHLHNILLLGFVASFCTKLSDTVSSEIGKAYGNTTYLVTTFEVVPRGTEGAVSVEGTVAGLSAATLLAALGYFMHLIDAPAAVVCVAASQIANLGESMIGASFQDKEGFQWVRTVKVSNLSLGATEQDVKEFFSFSGEIDCVELKSGDEWSQIAYVTFKDSKGAETALLLSGATIVDQSVIITLAADYHPPLARVPASSPLLQDSKSAEGSESAIQKAEDVVSTVLAKGFILGKGVLDKAKSLDEKHQLTSTASAKVVSMDKKIGLSERVSMGTAAVNEKVKEMDQKFQVSEKTKSAFATAEQKVSGAGSAILKNRYVFTGASWVTGAFNRVSGVAADVGSKTKEKCAAEQKSSGEQS